MHIVISGNMGSGKTTLATMLARHYGWEKRFEPVVENPYLDDYYKDIPRWSFAIEVFFLKQRFKDLLDIQRSTATVIQDRSIYEGVYVFTANNHAQGNLSDRDFDTYMELFQLMTSLVTEPDLMVYLKASVPHLIGNIQKRGREYEQGIPIDYLQGLNDRYEDFIENKYKGKKLIIPVDNLDFEHDRAHFANILDKIDNELFGLFA